MVLALMTAVAADGLQLSLNAFGFVGADQVIDAIAFVLTAWALGFHLLLLPTFVIELIPVADMLPTWTACVIAVIALRKREQSAPRPPDLPPKSAKLGDKPTSIIDLPP